MSFCLSSGMFASSKRAKRILISVRLFNSKSYPNLHFSLNILPRCFVSGFEVNTFMKSLNGVTYGKQLFGMKSNLPIFKKYFWLIVNFRKPIPGLKNKSVLSRSTPNLFFLLSKICPKSIWIISPESPIIILSLCLSRTP